MSESQLSVSVSLSQHTAESEYSECDEIGQFIMKRVFFSASPQKCNLYSGPWLLIALSEEG